LIVWGIVLPTGQVYLLRLKGKFDSIKYVSLTETEAIPVPKAHFDERLIHFQQENAPTNTSNYTLPRLEALGLDVMKWPARSPDLNIMENVWEMISDIVYDGPQFENLENLWEVIFGCCTGD
jgi:hypothetical protein